MKKTIKASLWFYLHFPSFPVFCTQTTAFTSLCSFPMFMRTYVNHIVNKVQKGGNNSPTKLSRDCVPRFSGFLDIVRASSHADRSRLGCNRECETRLRVAMKELRASTKGRFFFDRPFLVTNPLVAKFPLEDVSLFT